MQPLSYLEALLLEEIAQYRAESVSNRFETNYYVNNQHADESMLPLLQKFVANGLLDVKKERENITYYYINDTGRKALYHSMLLIPKLA